MEAPDAPVGGGALKAGGLAALVLVAALAGWWMLGRSPSTVPQALAPALSAGVLPVAASSAPVASDTVAPSPSPAAVLAAERLRESIEAVAQRDRAHQLELDQQRAKLAKEAQRAEEARRRAEAPQPPRPVAAESTQPLSAPVPAPVAAAPVAPVAAPASTGATVDQVCAGASNFLTRDFCRIRECGKPAFASDPVCVRFRQMEEARRQQSN